MAGLGGTSWYTYFPYLSRSTHCYVIKHHVHVDSELLDRAPHYLTSQAIIQNDSDGSLFAQPWADHLQDDE